MGEAVRAVMCSVCSMWEVRVNTVVPDDHTCKRCIQLQLLSARVRELEQELDELRIIREVETEIDRSYREVVTPKSLEVGKWVTVKKGRGSRQREQRTPAAIPINNRYTVLDTVDGDDPPGTSCSGPASGTVVEPSTRKGRRDENRALVLGDSIVRGADRRFCGADRESRMVCCLPGARVRDISNGVQAILEKEGMNPDVVLHVGTHDVGRMSEGVLLREFRELGVKLKGRSSRVTISGLLPVPRASEAKNRMIMQINTRLRAW